MKTKRIKRTKGSATILIMTVVISGALSSVLGIRQVQRITTEPLWVASVDLQAGQRISYDSLREIRADKNSGGLKSPQQIVGRTLNTNKKSGEPFYSNDMAMPNKSWLAEKVPEGRVLYTLVPNDNTIPYTQLRNGDRFDVLVTGRRGVRTVANNVRLIAALSDKSDDDKNAPEGRSLLTRLASKPEKAEETNEGSTPLVIAVLPEEVYPLASIGFGENVSLVLHGEREVKQGTLLDINPITVTHHQVEVFNGLERKQVYTRY